MSIFSWGSRLYSSDISSCATSINRHTNQSCRLMFRCFISCARLGGQFLVLTSRSCYDTTVLKTEEVSAGCAGQSNLLLTVEPWIPSPCPPAVPIYSHLADPTRFRQTKVETTKLKLDFLWIFIATIPPEGSKNGDKISSQEYNRPRHWEKRRRLFYGHHLRSISVCVSSESGSRRMLHITFTVRHTVGLSSLSPKILISRVTCE